MKAAVNAAGLASFTHEAARCNRTGEASPPDRLVPRRRGHASLPARTCHRRGGPGADSRDLARPTTGTDPASAERVSEGSAPRAASE